MEGTSFEHPKRGEFALIETIRRHAAASVMVPVGIGDDCAVVNGPGGQMVITTDLVNEGVHFKPDDPLRKIGWKAAAVSFSDVAAMGLRPEVLLCAAALPGRLTMDDAREIFLGVNDACREFGVALAGGDTTSSRGGLSLCTTVLAYARDLRPVLRSGAKPGDAIVVTGSLGGSILGRHLDVRPRVEEAVALNSHFELHAMIDVSDGLSADLNHILEESSVGAVIDADRVPVSDAAREFSEQTRKTPLQHALTDGEDFELLFTMPPGEAQRLIERPPFATPLTVIGSITAAGLSIRIGDKTEPFEPGGYEHFVE